MGPAELLLHHYRLELHATELRATVERLEQRLAADPEVVRVSNELELARAGHSAASLRLRDVEREVEGHRVRVKSRNAELMSGRIRNPTELMQMSAEVDHMRARLSSEEDAELEVMAEVEAAESSVERLSRDLEAARSRAQAEAPSLQSELESARRELGEVEAELQEVWGRVPAPAQAMYRRVRARPPVAEVVGGQCSACHVAITSSQAQHLRRGELLQCDNCGRMLVAA